MKRAKNKTIGIVTMFSAIYARNLTILPVVLLVAIMMTGFLHEVAHYIIASLLGVPVLKFSLFDKTYFSPTLILGPIHNRSDFLLISYSGGLLTGLFWLAIYQFFFIHKKHAEKTLTLWSIGLFLASLAYWQLVQGTLEGLFHQDYLSGAGKPFSASVLIQVLSILFGSMVYFKQTYFWRKKRST